MSSITNQKEKKEKQDVWVEVDPIEFDHQCQTKYVTSLDLAQMFNAFFKSCLEDYEGCFLAPKPGNIQNNETMVELSVYLTKKNNGTSSEGKIISLVDLARDIDVSKANMIQRINNINNRAASKLYRIEEDSKKFFESLAYQGKWDEKFAIEQVDANNRNVVLVKILNLDPVKILKKIYGAKVDGEEFEYRLTAVKIAGPNNYMLKIDRLNENNMKALAAKIGYVQPNASNILIVR